MQDQTTRAHDILAIFLVSIAHASSHFYHLVIPSLFPWILPHFNLNYLQGGTLVSTFFVTSALGQSATGFLVDKIGPRLSMYLGLICLASSAFVLGLADNVPMLFAASILAGLGNSVFHPADYSLMNYNISQRYLGHAFAWHNITGNIGWAICPFFMVLMAENVGWREAAFAASSVALIVLGFQLFFRDVFSIDQSSKKFVSEEKDSGGAFSFLAVPSVWMCFFFFFFTSGAFGVLQSFSQSIFRNAYGLNLAGASAALTAYLIGAGTGVAAPSRDIMIRSATVAKLGQRSFGRVYGFTYCGMDVGQSLSPLVFGPLLDKGMFSLVLFGVAALQTAAIFTALQVSDGEKKADVPSGA
ncbi:MFS transporter [uncultured Parasutterella sp.]|uniref:MFS transporter n=1 Tax=uncultured Parasutterella sp. TaxID=1263098 RepID=UPI00259539A1|nr:MFS transporter [uncultured Parasutterella sp.]